MSKTKFYVSSSVAGLIITTLAVGTLASAGNGDAQSRREQFQNNRSEMSRIMEDNDYNAWQSNMNERVNQMRQRADDLSKMINEDKFNIMRQAHQLMQNNEIDQAKQLLENNDITMMGAVNKFNGRNDRPMGIGRFSQHNQQAN